jgi:hypothetical protein
MTIAVRSSALSGAASISGTLVVTAPPNIFPGDLLYVLFGTDGASPPTPATVSSGWTQESYDAPSWLIPSPADLGALHLAVLTKVAGINEPSTYTFNVGTGANVIASMMAISGAATAQLDVLPAYNSVNTASTSHVANSNTPASMGDLLICHYICAPSLNSTTAYSPASGMTVQHQGPDDSSAPYYYFMTSTQVLTSTAATGTKTATFVSSQDYWVMTVLLRPLNPSLVQMTGFEHGSSYGFRQGIAGKQQADGITGVEGTNLVVQNSVAHNGGYALRCVSTSSQTASISWTNASLGTTQVIVGRFWFLVENIIGAGGSDRPAILRLNSTTGGTTTAYLKYDEPTGNLIMTVGTGTAQSAFGVVSLNNWNCIDFRFNSSGTTWTVDWRVNGVNCSQATSGTVTAQNVSEVLFGTSTAYNIVLDYDDIVLSNNAVDYPLPNMHIINLPVIASGTHNFSFNFQQTTNNGSTMNAISNPEQLIKDIPPNLGSGTDAVAQTTSGTTSYLEFLHGQVGNAFIYAVKHVVAGWVANSSSTNISVVLLDGATNGNTLGTPASPTNPSFINSTTTLGWANALYILPPSGGTWTTALVNALRSRIGWSTSVSAEPGANAIYLEVALTPDSHPKHVSVKQAVKRASLY